MAQYKYKSLKADGVIETGRVEASDEAGAYRLVRDKGLAPYELERVPEGAVEDRLRLFRRRVGAKDRARYIRQMATLLSAGMPLLDVMDSMARGGHPDLQRRSQDIRKALRAGDRLSAAMGRSLPDFPDYVPQLCELGETTGALAEALKDAATRMEHEEALRRDIRSALTYPAFLAVAGVAITLLMFIFVIPRFEALIGDRATDLPALSAMVLNSSSFLRENGWLLALALAGGGMALAVALRSGQGRAALRRLLDRLPVVGPFLRRADLANWARTMGVAMKNGAPLLTAYDLAARTVRSLDFEVSLRDARRKLRAGEPLDEAVGPALKLDAAFTDLLRTGRQAAALDEMLLFVADILDEDARERSKRLTALAEPIAIVLISLVVGTLVLGIVLAMTSLYDVTV